MNSQKDYTPRDWAVVEVAFDVDFKDSVQTSPLAENACGIDSEMADRLEKRGAEPFYYDVEQVFAGIDKVYGLSDLFVTTKDFTFPDGTVAREGALIYAIHRLDFDAKTRTVLVEKI